MSNGNGKDVEAQVAAAVAEATSPVPVFAIQLVFGLDGTFRNVAIPKGMDRALLLPLILESAAAISKIEAKPKSNLILPRDV